MYSLFRGPSSARKPARALSRLRLVALDDRIVPSAPTITSLSGEIIGSTIIVYGQESDTSSGQSSGIAASADTVTISGAINQTKTVSSSGQFIFTAPYLGNGSVVVAAQDSGGDQSGNYTLSLTPTSNPAPIITLQTVNNG